MLAGADDVVDLAFKYVVRLVLITDLMARLKEVVVVGHERIKTIGGFVMVRRISGNCGASGAVEGLAHAGLSVRFRDPGVAVPARCGIGVRSDFSLGRMGGTSGEK